MDKRKKRVFGNTAKVEVLTDPNQQQNLTIPNSTTETQINHSEIDTNVQPSPPVSENLIDSNSNSNSNSNSKVIPSILSSPTNASSQVRKTISSEYREQDVYTCPVCNKFSGNVSEINLHLSVEHFSIPKASSSPSQRKQDGDFDLQLEDVRDSVFGFFRSTGQKVKGFGDVITAGKLSSELERLGLIEASNAPFSSARNLQVQDIENSEDRNTVPNAIRSLKTPKELNKGGVCAYPNCNKPVTSATQQFVCECCKEKYCAVHGVSDMSENSNHHAKNECQPRYRCARCAAIDFGDTSNFGGPSRSHYSFYFEKRAGAVKNFLLEATRIQNRLEKLSFAYTSLEAQYPQGLGSIENSARKLLGSSFVSNPQRDAEMNIVPWEDDKIVKSCSLCGETLNSLSKRRHHCRLCGKIVCGKKPCSSIIRVPLINKTHLKKNTRTVGSRACTSCIKSLVTLQERQRPTENSQLQILYKDLCSFNEKIKGDFVTMRQLITRVINAQVGQPKTKLLQQANNARKDLQKLINRYDAVSKEILSLPKSKNIELRLYKSIRQAAVLNVQAYTVELSAISQTMLSQSILNNPADNKSKIPNLARSGTIPTVSLGSFGPQNSSNVGGTNQGSATSSSPPRLPTRIASNPETHQTETSSEITASNDVSDTEVATALLFTRPKDTEKTKERLSVLREQRVLVQGYIKQLTQKREWATVQSLTYNLNDLDQEISILERSL